MLGVAGDCRTGTESHQAERREVERRAEARRQTGHVNVSI